MRPISSSGSVSPLAQLSALRVASQPRKAPASSGQSQKFDPMAAARSKDLATSIRLQHHEPYNLGNAFAHYESLAAS